MEAIALLGDQQAVWHCCETQANVGESHMVLFGPYRCRSCYSAIVTHYNSDTAKESAIALKAYQHCKRYHY
eukprot:12560-Heterococcus_DN1.PRE.2